MSEGTDEFGHVTTRTDLGGNTTSFSYDKGGRLTGQSSGLGQLITYAYYNSGKIQTITDGAAQSNQYYTNSVTSSFTYDVSGNRLTSSYVSLSGYAYYYYGTYYSTPIQSTLENSTATYDAMNRITGITDPGDSTNRRPSFSLARTYDANSNVRSAITAHQSIDSAQNLVTTVVTDAYWYRYDSLNRFVVNKGSLSGTAGASGTTIGITVTVYLGLR